MDIPVKDVHIGTEILKRLDELKISKSEFGRRIGVRQQHVNRIFDMHTLDTGKLSAISAALDFNFFSLYVDFSKSINANKSALSMGQGDASLYIGDEALSARIRVLEVQLESANKDVARVESEKESLNSQLKDKSEIIELLKEKLTNYEN